MVLQLNPDIVSDHGPPLAQPSVVLLFTVVGFADVLHAIPLTDIAPPPFELIVPPLTAELCVTDEAELVVTVGATGFTEHEVYVYDPDIEPLEHVLV